MASPNQMVVAPVDNMEYKSDFELGWKMKSGLLQEIRTYGEWLLFSDITMRGEYQAARDWLLQQPREKELTIVDLGANVGFTSFYLMDGLLQKGFRFKNLLVEAHLGNFGDLSRRLEANKKVLGQNIAVPICGLVGKRYGKAHLRTDGLNTIYRAFENKPDGVSHEVSYVDLEDYLDDSPVDLIKCDIEGSEVDFVKNYRPLLNRTRFLVLELHSSVPGVKEIPETLLNECGFLHRFEASINGDCTTECFWK